MVICDPDGIHLYRLPELESEWDETTLTPFWTSGRSLGEWCRGSLCDASSPNPTLYVHCPDFMEEVEFGLDESGRFFVVSNYDTVEETILYGGDSSEDVDCFVRLKGRKVLSYETEYPFITFATAFLDRWGVGRALRMRIANSPGDRWIDVGMVDLDERTGRLLIAADHSATIRAEIQPSRHIFLADIPE